MVSAHIKCLNGDPFFTITTWLYLRLYQKIKIAYFYSMKNSIAQRIADFLKEHPPFDGLTREECYELATQIEVVYLAKQKCLFLQDDQTHQSFYVVHQGLMDLHVKKDDNDQLIDVCDDGDVIGLRPFFAGQNYAMSATAKTDTLLYAIPFEAFNNYLKHSNIANFLMKSFASNQRQPNAQDRKGVLLSHNLIADQNDTSQERSQMDFFQKIDHTPDPFCVIDSAIIREVAEYMTELNISSVIIVDNELPIGIVTDKDLRKHVVTGKTKVHQPIKDIMSSPVLCIKRSTSVAQAQLMMLQYHIGHLCITADGTNKSRVIGILSEHDIVTAQANNPAALQKAIKRAGNIEELSQVRSHLGQMLESYLSQDLPITHCLSLTNALHDSIYKVCADLCLRGMSSPPPCNFAWLNLGSQARNEQLLLTDQDHALVYEDVADYEHKKVKTYFLELGKRLSDALARIGFEHCPANMMASNPAYCLSLNEWKEKFRQWIKSPTEKSVMLCSIFFDFQLIYGDKKLHEELSRSVFDLLNGDQTFFAYLASDALKNPPPLSFFKQFVVEDDGEHKDEFDLKARAIMPLVDAARVLALSNNIAGANQTVSRFKQLMIKEPQNAELYKSCVKSFYDLLRFRSKSGFAQNDTGRFVELDTLSKRDKSELKYAFKPIKSLQTNLKTRFRLTYFQ